MYKPVIYELLSVATQSVVSTTDDLRSALESILENRYLAESDSGRLSKKARGTYYTPDYIVKYTVSCALFPILEKAGALSRAGSGNRKVEPYLEIRVLDAAAGSGRFLQAAADEIASAVAGATGMLKEFAFRLVVENCIYGVDLDDAALEAARLTLWHTAGREDETLSILRRHLVAGNALIARGVDSAGIDWRNAFPEVFSRSPSGFDAVVGNPPWISFSGRQSVNTDKGALEYLYKRWPASKGWPSAHGMFLELAVELCRPGGIIGQIVPEQILDLDRYAPLRRIVLEKAVPIAEPVKVAEKAFVGVTCPSCVVLLMRGDEASMGIGEPIRATATLTPAGITREATYGIADRIIEKMKAFPPLPPKTFADPGVHTGNCAQYLIPESPPDGCVPMRVGRDVTRYNAGAASLWLVESPDVPDGGYYRIRAENRYTDARILIRQTASHPIAARHTYPCHFRNSLLACYGAEGLSDEYLLVILNSKLVKFFHQRQFRDGRQQAFPQVKVSHLRSIPLPRPEQDATGLIPQLESLVHQAEEAARAGDSSSLASTDGQIDRIIYNLYGLDEEEVTEVET